MTEIFVGLFQLVVVGFFGSLVIEYFDKSLLTKPNKILDRIEKRYEYVKQRDS